eukprot:4574456-Amphidinium_carterae.1
MHDDGVSRRSLVAGMFITLLLPAFVETGTYETQEPHCSSVGCPPELILAPWRFCQSFVKTILPLVVCALKRVHARHNASISSEACQRQMLIQNVLPCIALLHAQIMRSSMLLHGQFAIRQCLVLRWSLPNYFGGLPPLNPGVYADAPAAVARR